jgi:hypothetical protein
MRTSPRERAVRRLLRELIDRIAAEHDHYKTVEQIVQEGLEEGCVLYEPMVPEVVAREMRRMARRQLGKSRKSGGAPARQPLLGFEEIEFPVHIVIPPLEHVDEEFDGDEVLVEDMEDEDEVAEDRWPWVVLQRATIIEVERNVTYRDRLLTGAQRVRDRLNAAAQSAREVGGGDDDVIGDILGGLGTP